MNNKMLVIILLSVVSASSLAASEPFVVVDGSKVNDRIESFELGDVNGDGVDEIIYLSSFTPNLKSVSYTKSIDENFLSIYDNSTWRLREHKYTEGNHRFEIIFVGNGAYFRYDGKLSECIPLEFKNGYMYGNSGNTEIYVERITDFIIQGQIKDARIDSMRAVPSTFTAVIERR